MSVPSSTQPPRNLPREPSYLTTAKSDDSASDSGGAASFHAPPVCMCNGEEVEMPPLDGRVAMVTGASRGMGYAIAAELSSAGAKIIANFHPDFREGAEE